MEHGALEEHGDVFEILRSPARPCTRRLIAAAPSLVTTTDPAGNDEVVPL